MEVKNELVFEVKKGEERVYKFTIPVNAPLGESYEAVCQFRDRIVQLINEHVAKQQEAERPKETEEDSSKTEE